jgi:hypothetical protein
VRRLLAMLSRRAECVAQGSAFAGVSEVIVGGEVSGGDVGISGEHDYGVVSGP